MSSQDFGVKKIKVLVKAYTKTHPKWNSPDVTVSHLNVVISGFLVWSTYTESTHFPMIGKKKYWWIWELLDYWTEAYREHGGGNTTIVTSNGTIKKQTRDDVPKPTGLYISKAKVDESEYIEQWIPVGVAKKIGYATKKPDIILAAIEKEISEN